MTNYNKDVLFNNAEEHFNYINNRYSLIAVLGIKLKT